MPGNDIIGKRGRAVGRNRVTASRTKNGNDGATVADHLFEALSQEILNGDIGPGERLVELHLTERFGVSRTPVREALSRLVENGIARRLAGGGIVAATEDMESILDTMRIMEVLSGLAARMVVERAGPRGIAKLRVALDDLAEAIGAGDNRAILDCTVQFHVQLWTLAECEQLLRMLMVVGVSNQRMRHSTLWREGRPEEMFRQTTELLEAIERHDADEAERILRGSVARSREVRREVESEIAERRLRTRATENTNTMTRR
jgi:DNA-binding GntR family transcriptional regulator